MVTYNPVKVQKNPLSGFGEQGVRGFGPSSGVNMRYFSIHNCHLYLFTYISLPSWKVSEKFLMWFWEQNVWGAWPNLGLKYSILRTKEFLHNIHYFHLCLLIMLYHYAKFPKRSFERIPRKRKEVFGPNIG